MAFTTLSVQCATQKLLLGFLVAEEDAAFDLGYSSRAGTFLRPRRRISLAWFQALCLHCSAEFFVAPGVAGALEGYLMNGNEVAFKVPDQQP